MCLRCDLRELSRRPSPIGSLSLLCRSSVLCKIIKVMTAHFMTCGFIENSSKIASETIEFSESEATRGTAWTHHMERWNRQAVVPSRMIWLHGFVFCWNTELTWSNYKTINDNTNLFILQIVFPSRQSVLLLGYSYYHLYQAKQIPFHCRQRRQDDKTRLHYYGNSLFPGHIYRYTIQGLA